MQIKIRIKIINDSETQFLGEGIIWLLEKIDKYGSINKAAKEMNMSYSKSWKIITNLEKNIGTKILKRKKGGSDRGGAELTPLAQEIIENYNITKNKISGYAEKIFAKQLKPILFSAISY